MNVLELKPASWEPVEPPAPLVEKALDRLVRADQDEFTNNLAIARYLWRMCRELVEAPTFPKDLRATCIEERGYDPENINGCGEKVLQPGFRETQRPNAIELARTWMLRERKKLEEMGTQRQERV
jgi:hypothetical protein